MKRRKLRMGPSMKVAEGAGWGKCDWLKTLPIDMYGPVVPIKTFADSLEWAYSYS